MRFLKDWGQLLVLAALLLTLFGWLRADIGRLDDRLVCIDARLAAFTERIAHIEGRLAIGSAPLGARPEAKD
ncbi:MAG: hypothetical protein OXN89_06265 [Bryobacterales bacterium]|nr:hypothetical protein [Bryobacterales bacterium]